MIKVLFICHGNICRSPMAESIMTHLIHTHHLESVIVVASAATSREEIGNGVHPGTRRRLAKAEIPCVPHTAIQMTREDYDHYNYLIGMDDWNLRNMLRICGGDPKHKLYKLLDFTDRKGADIADPWYTGNFDETYADISEGCQGLLTWLTDSKELSPK